MQYLFNIVWACVWTLYGLFCCHYCFRKSFKRAQLWMAVLIFLWSLAVMLNLYYLSNETFG